MNAFIAQVEQRECGISEAIAKIRCRGILCKMGHKTIKKICVCYSKKVVKTVYFFCLYFEVKTKTHKLENKNNSSDNKNFKNSKQLKFSFECKVVVSFCCSITTSLSRKCEKKNHSFLPKKSNQMTIKTKQKKKKIFCSIFRVSHVPCCVVEFMSNKIFFRAYQFSMS